MSSSEKSHEDSSSLEESSDYYGFDDSVNKKISNLALEMSTQSVGNLDDLNDNEYSESQIEMDGVNTFQPGNLDPQLNPKSPDFNSKLWVRNLRRMMDLDPDYYKHTKLSVVYRNLRAYGVAVDSDYQNTVLNLPIKAIESGINLFRRNKSRYFDILKPMDGYIEAGTVTVVLGRPGAGCSTFLKTIAANTYGFHVGSESRIAYDSLTPSDIKNNYRGEVTYSAETDVHFPHLPVRQTLEFSAALRTPQNRPPGITRDKYAKHMTDVYMATYGLSHTENTVVGNEFVRGVSGGERKRVSIAEVSLCGSYVQCWDNATRGLDSATALEFIRALKTSADVLESTPLIAIYQCSQDAYDLFDNTVLLYEGYQIYFGPANKAKDFFIKMGYKCPDRQTTPDFLTSLTNPSERVVLPGYEGKVPVTPLQFSEYWRTSPEYQALVNKIDSHFDQNDNNTHKNEFTESHIARQANRASSKSPYTLSFGMQVSMLMKRNFWRFKSNPGLTLGGVIGNSLMGLIIATLFLNLSNDTATFYYRSAALFMGVLFNCFSSLLEILSLFEARPIVEKHKQFALYRPSADALASILTELPPKIVTSLCFNIIFYFTVNLRRDAGHFFFYLFVGFLGTLAMSHIFRTIGSFIKTRQEAMTPASLILLALTVYSGFAIPTTFMRGWARWIAYINPIAYAFESLIANEFHGRIFKCVGMVPFGSSYDSIGLENKVCPIVSGLPGEDFINGTSYLKESFDYYYSNRWRNVGIIIAFIVFFLFTYLLGCEINKGAMQKGEIILFERSELKRIKKRKKKMKKLGKENIIVDETDDSKVEINMNIQANKEIFHWRDVCYDVQIKDETRRILDNVDGWIKPGTLTALMGASGAGKTTLLDVLAKRVTMGVIRGHIFVNGKLRDESFQRSTGYVQQQDLHLQTSTVREALRFSAYLRQPQSVSIKEKNAYVEEVIDILEMREYANAIVGVAGEGLNVEQRKRLTIGVELAAKPKLLLFLDEPTSGLDSQTAWSVCQLMRKLADRGQSILCTIHQPSAILMQEFDRLLFLQKGGKTVYFGDLGKNCSTLIKYFESKGAPKCPPNANPAEWMLDVIGAAPGSTANRDYHEAWLNSKEYKNVQKELRKMENTLVKEAVESSEESKKEFATSIWSQFLTVIKRVFEQYYRTPSYIWSKLILAVFSALFNGFSFFNADTSQQGLQNQMISVFMSTMVVNTLINQMTPLFIDQRTLYEARERPSKTFSWFAFISAQIIAEIPWQIFAGTLSFFCWYYPVGLYSNAIPTGATAQRGVLTWMFIVSLYVYTSTLGQATVAAVGTAEEGGHIASILFMMALNFCGVLKLPTGFWTFMYHVSPFKYWVQGMLTTALANNEVVCSAVELVKLVPPTGMTCIQYMGTFIDDVGGYLSDPNATDSCGYCPMSETNTFLTSINAIYSERWRNWAIFSCYIIINIIICISVYYLARVPNEQKNIDEMGDESKEVELVDKS